MNKMIKAKILLLSGYDAPSHQYWREAISENLCEFEWTQIALPPRYFSWRIRGNAFNFFNQFSEILNRDFDLIIATSMVDLSNLCGLIPNFANTPKLLYFHENQFAYPLAKGDLTEKQNAINAQITSIFSAICVDRILFNSNFNLNSFFNGANKLSKKLPDGITKECLRRLNEKSCVLPVPIKIKRHLREQVTKSAPVKILWNHRWEFDKQPEVFVEAMLSLKEQGISFHLYILGQSFRNKPECLENVKDSLQQEVKVIGFQPREDYDRIMQNADIVISSALHDFQGLSMLEAIFKGCIPIAPNRVAYPEYIDPKFLYEVKDKNNSFEADSLVEKVMEIIKSNEFNQNRAQLIKDCQVKVESYNVNSLISRYKHEIRKLID